MYPLKECEVEGITCNSDRYVTEIKFDGNNLDGTNPVEIEDLLELRILDVGNVPNQLGELKYSTFVDIADNDLVGDIGFLCSIGVRYDAGKVLPPH